MRLRSRINLSLIIIALGFPATTSAGLLDDILEKGKQVIGADSCRAYSDFTCAQLENSQYNAYFYFPDNKEVYLGEAYSLSGCGSMAHSYANRKGLSRGDRWGYICCLIAKGSSCYEKHR